MNFTPSNLIVTKFILKIPRYRLVLTYWQEIPPDARSPQTVLPHARPPQYKGWNRSGLQFFYLIVHWHGFELETTNSNSIQSYVHRLAQPINLTNKKYE